jgi:hypothetical protein
MLDRPGETVVQVSRVRRGVEVGGDPCPEPVPPLELLDALAGNGWFGEPLIDGETGELVIFNSRHGEIVRLPGRGGPVFVSAAVESADLSSGQTFRDLFASFPEGEEVRCGIDIEGWATNDDNFFFRVSHVLRMEDGGMEITGYGRTVHSSDASKCVSNITKIRVRASGEVDLYVSDNTVETPQDAYSFLAAWWMAGTRYENGGA